MMQGLIEQFRAALGKEYVLTDDADKVPYLTDWRKRYTGKALAVLLPKTTDEVANIVKLCAAHHVAIVPQGGHTGFCGGATPDNSGNQVILNLKGMNQIRAIDTANQTITLEAGCILQAIQEKAAAQDFFVSTKSWRRRQLYDWRQLGHQCWWHECAALWQYS